MEPGDICPDCETVGIPGALCPKHAAADDLLAACKLVVKCYKGTTAHEQVPAWEAVLAAIARAESR